MGTSYNIANKTVLFTGATSGLGRVAALKIAAEGAKVIALYRDREKGETLIDDFKGQYPNSSGSIELVECDLSSLKSVRSTCNFIKENYTLLDIIVNNSGTWNFTYSQTEDGIENTFQVNLLAPKLFIDLLLNLLFKSDNPKVINTASALHQGTINFEDIEFKKSFSGFKSYQQSKLGIILLTRFYQNQFVERGVHFYSQHPGLVDTGLVRKGGAISKLFFKIFGKNPKKGAETLIHLLFSSPSELSNGEYYANRKPTKTKTSESYDLELAEKLNSVCNKYLENYLA